MLPSFLEEDEAGEAQRQRLIVLRHGERLQPSSPQFIKLLAKTPWDMPLSTGHATQCKLKADKLPASLRVGAVFVSPFTRCLQTLDAVLPHLNMAPGCKIFMHRGLSEVHSMSNMFPRQSAPSMTQRFALWRWHGKHDAPPPSYATVAGVAVEKKALGEWPTVPETDSQAQARISAAIAEAVAIAGTKDILIVTHGLGVEHAMHWVRPGVLVKNVDTLGHCEITRTLPDGKHFKAPTEWHIQEPSAFGDSRCGVDVVAEHGSGDRHTGLSAASMSSHWSTGRQRMDDALQAERLALESNPWWAMTDAA